MATWLRKHFFFQKSRKIFNSDQRIPRGCYLNSVPIPASGHDDWLKIVPVGSFPDHPDGAHDITPADIQAMFANLPESGVLVDLDHDSLFGNTRAAGWAFPGIFEARDDGLYWQGPELTPTVAEAVKNREWRFYSPVYRLNAKDRAGNKVGAMLDSVALTNRPWMMDLIDPIRNTNHDLEDFEMKLTAEELKQLGLPEDATQEQIEAAMKAKAFGEPEPAPEPEPEPAPEPEPDSDPIANAIAALTKKVDDIIKNESTTRAAELVDAAVKDVKIAPADRQVYLNNAIADYEGTKALLDKRAKNSALPGGVTLPDDSDPDVKKNTAQLCADFLTSKIKASQAARA